MWYDKLENSEKGRDFCVEKAKKLSEMDLKKISFSKETPVCEKIAKYYQVSSKFDKKTKYEESAFKEIFEAMKEDDNTLRYDSCICFSGHFFAGKKKKKKNLFFYK